MTLQDCDCEGGDDCPICACILTLNVSNRSNEVLDVTTDHLLPLSAQDCVRAVSQSGMPILLAKLRKNQEIKLTAVARKVRAC